MSFHTGETITIPSPIDVHAHLREPGGSDKETIASGTLAALYGGYQAVYDMPNNPGGYETRSEQRLNEKYIIATNSANTNIGFYAGIDLENPDIDEIPRMIGKSAGLKLYMGHTTGNTAEHDLGVARPAIDAWIEASREIDGQPPILLHAREGVGEETAEYIASREYPAHWCHVSTASEASSSRRLSGAYPEFFTAGITGHHMTMTSRDADFKYGWNGGRMMPRLSKEADHDALVSAFNKGYIQILETDHAPHTDQAKLYAESENPEGNDEVGCATCFGVSGIEFVLPVMMSLVQRKIIEMDRLVDALHTQPIRMLGLKKSGNRAETTIDIRPYTITEADRVGMSKNNPYVGWTAWGRISQVAIDGVTRFRYQTYVPEFNARVLTTGSEI